MGDSVWGAKEERLAMLVHGAYCKEYKRQKGQEYWTKGDYSLLDEPTKDFDRASVRAVLEGLKRQ